MTYTCINNHHVLLFKINAFSPRLKSKDQARTASLITHICYIQMSSVPVPPTILSHGQESRRVLRPANLWIQHPERIFHRNWIHQWNRSRYVLDRVVLSLVLWRASDFLRVLRSVIFRNIFYGSVFSFFKFFFWAGNLQTD